MFGSRERKPESRRHRLWVRARDGPPRFPGLGGAVACYFIIHTPPARLPGVFREFARVPAPGGFLLLAFQTGDEPRHISHASGHDVNLDAFRLKSDHVTAVLENAGLTAHSKLLRTPDESEKTPQAFLLARKQQYRIS